MSSSSSSSMSNPEGNNNNSIRPLESKRKKRRKIVTENHADEAKIERNRWRTDSARQIYSVKLIEALRQTRRSPTVAGGAVRETADRVLAVSAKGRTRWSRSILTNQLRLKHSQIKRHKKAKVASGVRPSKPAERRPLPVLQKKVQVLGKLVPGCRKLSFPSLLEEATDYIAALEMQVRAMTALAGLLSGAEPLAAAPERLGSSPS